MEGRTALPRGTLPGSVPIDRLSLPGEQTRVAAPANANLSIGVILFALGIHAPLLLIFLRFPIFATIYSFAVLAAGLYFLIVDEHPTRVAWTIAYIAGAEIIWRGAEASVVWEYGKYATLVISILAILKYLSRGKSVFWPFLFLILLVPGLMLMPRFDREAISFQLAGPVCLAVVSLLFSKFAFSRAHLQRLLLALIAPTAAVGFLVLYSIATNDIVFLGTGENELVTGQIGANQVSSALSLGSTAAFLFMFLTGKKIRLRYTMIVIGLTLLGLSILTFSRAGLYNTLGALFAAVLFLVRDRRQLLKIGSLIIGPGLIVYLFVLPLYVQITGGAVLTRFGDTDTTGRDILVEIDLQVFRENPILGIGVGQSEIEHITYFGYPKPTHTEYSRLLAEHGSLGLGIIVLLAGVLISRVRSDRAPLPKGITVGFTVWALLYLIHSATRMVAPSFAFGLAAAHLLPEEDDPPA